jgi:glycosyltransferase involved in cell wall biosynthesis
MVEEKTIIEPLVSIIIATLNSERFLRDALTSVESQGYSNFEILMIDGGSTDNTKKIGSSFKKVKIIEQSGKGLFVAWNEGLIAAKGDFIAFLDSDDFWGKDALGEHMKALLGEPNSLGSLGRLKFFVEDGQKPPAEFKLSLLNGDHLAYMPGCFVGRKEIFELIGLFETQWEIE